MAYDEGLAHRVRELLTGRFDTVGAAGPVRGARLAEKKMFGGLAFLLDGNMACATMGDDLLVRIDPTTQAEALAAPGARPFTMGTRTGKGWVVVAGDSVTEDDDLHRWVETGATYALSLPVKG